MQRHISPIVLVNCNVFCQNVVLGLWVQLQKITKVETDAGITYLLMVKPYRQGIIWLIKFIPFFQTTYLLSNQPTQSNNLDNYDFC